MIFQKVLPLEKEFGGVSHQRKYVVLSFDEMVFKYHYSSDKVCAFYSF